MTVITNSLLTLRLVALLAIALPAHAADNLWTVEGPDGAVPESFAVAPSNPDVIYMATAVGLHRSDDGGVSWSLIYAGFSNGPGAFIIADPSDPDTVFVPHRQQGFFVSVDGGTTFTARHDGLPVGSSSLSPSLPTAVRASDGDIFADTDGTGIWVTTDNGLTWTSANTGLPAGQSTAFARISLLAVAPNDPDHLIAYVLDTDEIYFTRDAGVLWTPATTQPPVTNFVRDLAIDPFDADHALLVGNQVFETLDGGANWSLISPAPLATRVAFDFGVPDRVFVGASSLVFPGSGIHRSDDGGSTWTLESSLDARDWGLVWSLESPPGGGGWMLAGTVNGAYRRAVDGSEWSLNASGVLGNTPEFLAPSPDQHDVVFASNNANMYVSDDAGANWEAIDNDLPADALVITGAVDPEDGTNLYLADVNSDFFFSDDRGQTWSQLGSLPGGYAFSLALLPGTPPAFIAGQIDGAIARSDDGGLTWTALPSPSTGYVTAVAVAPGDNDVIVVGDSGGNLFRSTNGGAIWIDVTPEPSAHIVFIAFDPHAPSSVYAGGDVNGGTAHRSSDGGQTWTAWTSLPASIAGPGDLQFHPTSMGIQYLSTRSAFVDGQGFWRSTNNGQSWVPFVDRDEARLGPYAWGPKTIAVDPLKPYRVYAATRAGAATYEFARDLTLTLTTANTDINLLEQAVYSFTVVNGGPGTAAEVTVSLPLPTNTAFVGADTIAGSCSLHDGQILCVRPALAGGSNFWAIDVTLQPTAFGPIAVTAVSGSVEKELNPGDNNVANSAVTVVSVDLDDDGVGDNVDNCLLVANADQRDTNSDGYGNACDADLNDSGNIDFADLEIMRALFFGADPDADLDGDGAVNFSDLHIMKSTFFGPPGPSGPLL